MEQAITCFRKEIALQPDYVAAYNQIGNALQTFGRSDLAIALNSMTIPPQLLIDHIYQRIEKILLAFEQLWGKSNPTV